MDAPSTRTPAGPAIRPGAARLLLVLAAAGLAGTAICAAGWIWTARSRVPVEALDPEERQALVADLLEQSPGAFVPAWFHPPVGYTLRPGARITAWDDTFTANELGYRTRPAAKAEGAQRVVFAGSSWTFGMGVPEADTVPAQFERLAGGAAAPRRVEAWNLALPAYNVLHELAALEFFFDRLRPDAVVLCPTINEIDSGGNVLPNGSLTRAGVVRDGFGADHSLVYSLRLVDSHQFRARWRAAFAEVRRAEERLRARGVPLLVYFTGTWDEPFAHWLVAESVLLRRRPGATRLVVTLRRLHGLPSLYPLPVTVEVLSAAGGVRAAATVPAGGPDVHRFSLPLPADVRPGAALDVVLRAGRVVSAPEALAPRSVRIEEIAQR